jgi:hypothetical protein
MDIFLTSKVLKIVFGVVVGGVLGYLYYKLVGCSSGACPITSNKYSSIIYGALVGFLFTSK